MRIVSKYKDYYDYLSGTWGVDPLITIDRREFDIPYCQGDFNKINLYIAGKNIQGIQVNGLFYYGEDIAQFSSKESEWYVRLHGYSVNQYLIKKEISDTTRDSVWIEKYPVDSDVNEKLGCPILMTRYWGGQGKYDIKSYYKYPILKDLGLTTYINPQDMWNMLTDFLSKKDNYVDNRDNNEKIKGAGFDLKSSFRGKL